MTSANSAPAVKLGDELTVNAIGFGALALTPVYGEVNDTESLATLNRTLDLGLTFIDTANIYGNGNNEKLIAKLLADRRDEATLATKFAIQGNPADRGVGTSLHRHELGVGRTRVEDPCFSGLSSIEDDNPERTYWPSATSGRLRWRDMSTSFRDKGLPA